VRDLSSNGTFFNASGAAIGPHGVQPIRDRDRLLLGDYEVEIRLNEDAAFVFDDGAVAVPSPGFAAVPLPGLDDVVPSAVPGFSGPALQSFGAMPDHAHAAAQAFTPPASGFNDSGAAKPMVPDNWYQAAEPAAPPVAARSELSQASPFSPSPSPTPSVFPAPFPSSLAAPPGPISESRSMSDLFPISSAPVFSPAPSPALLPGSALGPVPAPAPAPVAAAPQAPTAACAAPAATATSSAAALAILLAGGELAPEMAARAITDPTAALHNAGAILRAAVGGMRALLIARGSVKREFRIEQTMLRTHENNPLKFAASDEQALSSLLDPRTDSLSALQEAIRDLTLHQVAVLAATQAAARALLERLDPSSLEAEDKGGGLFSESQEKRLWTAYKQRHSQLTEQFEDDFESAFGKAFARAYENAVKGVRN
jgi:type VI secretion system protein ImpI/type VI secretion system protein